jgi:hypothetical protein
MKKVGLRAGEVASLSKKINDFRKFKNSFATLPEEELTVVPKNKKVDKRKIIEEKIMELILFKKLFDMVDKGATGFELAHFTRKDSLKKKLLDKGILFHNTFLNVGFKKFSECPNMKEQDYKTFKTIEKTEKYFFVIWLKHKIESLEYEISLGIENLKDLKKCRYCEVRYKYAHQIICEKCGKMRLSLDILKELEFYNLSGYEII